MTIVAMFVRLPLAIILAATAAAANLWSISQRIEFVTNVTEEARALQRIDWGYYQLGFHSLTPHFNVSVVDIVPLDADDTLAENLSCSDSCQLWTFDFEGIAPNPDAVQQALFYVGYLAFYGDTDTPDFRQGPIGAFHYGPPYLAPVEFLNFYGATITHLDFPVEDEMAEAARSAALAAAGPEGWSITQLLELVTNATEEEVLEAVRLGYANVGFGAYLLGFNVSVVEVTPVPLEYALSANWSCSISCQHWVLALHAVSPDNDGAINALFYTGAFAYYGDSDTQVYNGPIIIDVLNFFGSTLVHLDQPVEEEEPTLVPVPGGQGCHTVTSRHLCCLYHDGRSGSAYGGEACAPAAPWQTFTSGNVCEPSCWTTGTCGTGIDQGDRSGTCLPADETTSETQTSTATTASTTTHTTTTADQSGMGPGQRTTPAQGSLGPGQGTTPAEPTGPGRVTSTGVATGRPGGQRGPSTTDGGRSTTGGARTTSGAPEDDLVDASYCRPASLPPVALALASSLAAAPLALGGVS